MALLRRDADAWDVVQEVFAKMLEVGSTFRGEARPMTWVYRITTNLALNALRGRALREPDAKAAEEPRSEGDGAEAAELIRALVARLPERACAVAAMHHLD